MTLSGGMQRRLLIARALIHRPELVLLDEPTVGLDPQVRQELWSLILALRYEGTTVLMSTHYIEEAERLADRVAIMSAGRVVAEGTPGQLIRSTPGARRSTSRAPPSTSSGWPARPARRAPTRPVRARADLPARRVRPMAGCRTASAGPATLEDVFVLLTGEYVE